MYVKGQDWDAILERYMGESYEVREKWGGQAPSAELHHLLEMETPRVADLATELLRGVKNGQPRLIVALLERLDVALTQQVG